MLSRFRATIVTLSCISQDCFGYCNCIVCLIVAFVCCIALRKLPWVTLIMLQWFGATSQRRWQWNIEQQCATGTGTQYINYHDGAYLVSLFTSAWRKELCQQEREVLMEFLSKKARTWLNRVDLYLQCHISFERSNEKQSYETSTLSAVKSNVFLKKIKVKSNGKKTVGLHFF